VAGAGGLWAGIGQMADGSAYDAELNAIFLGLIMSMIFAHAPVIVPSLLGRPLPFRRVVYVPLVLRFAGGTGQATLAPGSRAALSTRRPSCCS
jgi:hypothetical protein